MQSREDRIAQGMRPCCADFTNRRVVEKLVQTQNGVETVSTHTKCRVCANNHYLLEVPPIHFGMQGMGVG